MTTKRATNHASDVRGLGRLAVEATVGVTDVVESMHHTIGRVPLLEKRSPEGRTSGITGLVYKTIRGVTGAVGATIDMVLGQVAPLVGETRSFPEREALVAAINGVLGDYLVATDNPLATPMQLRRGGHALELRREALAAAFPGATGKLLVLVHGSSMNDLQWKRKGHDHGAALEKDLGYTAVYVNYNSGLHISTNGRELAEKLESLVAEWPVPVEEVTLLGHSMGGLVIRSACQSAAARGMRWPRALGRLVFLGTPHHGAPLERGGNWIDMLLGLTPYSAPLARLGKIRSAGVTDLRFGNVVDEDWHGRDRFAHGRDRRRPTPLPEGVPCHAIAATTAAAPGSAFPDGTTRAAAPAGALPGDGLVPLASALGRHEKGELALGIPEEHTWIAFGTKHLDLLSRPEVYAVIKDWLSAGAGPVPQK